ncbi:hypothetical protein ACFRQM_47310 [Streptomyces sp. NPDC056831]|uniref:hypothetical protein n=1 Tax=Streptomyces sp. NPDC056831 TaxID=3345954 RepID=UPI0036874CD6
MLTPSTGPGPTGVARRYRDNLIARIAEAQREGWFGEVEGLQVSLAGAEEKLAQLDRRPSDHGTIDLGIPAITGLNSIPRQPPRPETD